MTCQLEGAQLQGHGMLYQAIETMQIFVRVTDYLTGKD